MEHPRDFLWWRDGVIYQIYPLSFRDSNDDGFGDLPGITASLDYLANLGVDGIWLSPIPPKRDWGYDVSDYEGIDPVLGTMEDFLMLIEGAHRRGIRVIMDMVFTHTSDAHPWFKESQSSSTSPKADWYIWRDTPNNWVSYFGGSAENDPHSLLAWYRELIRLRRQSPALHHGRYRSLIAHSPEVLAYTRETDDEKNARGAEFFGAACADIARCEIRCVAGCMFEFRQNRNIRYDGHRSSAL